MGVSRDAVPMRWPSGPLEIARRGAKEKLTPQGRQVLERRHAGAELPRANTRLCEPGFRVAGRNCVNTDAVGMALMGFDPQADRGTAPFERCDSTLRLAEEHGVRTRDLRRIEVVGTPIAEARLRFREVRGPAPGV